MTFLIKKAYSPFLINKVIKKYLYYNFSSNQNQLKDKSNVDYFKLTYIGNLSHHIKNKIFRNFAKSFVKKINIKLVFNSFKIKNHDLKSFLVYKFTCASCSSRYVGKTCRHFKTKIEEHIKNDKPHIFKHLDTTTACFVSYNSLSSKTIDKKNHLASISRPKCFYSFCK